MGQNTFIAWTDDTFNIAWGCSKVSPGCQNCYADGLASLYGHDVWGVNKTRRTFGEDYWKKPLVWNRDAQRAGIRRRVFCASMCDVFENHATIDQEREKLWPLIRATPWLDWQILTKRAERIADNLPADWGHGKQSVRLLNVKQRRQLLFFDQPLQATARQIAERLNLSARQGQWD